MALSYLSLLFFISEPEAHAKPQVIIKYFNACDALIYAAIRPSA